MATRGGATDSSVEKCPEVWPARRHLVCRVRSARVADGMERSLARSTLSAPPWSAHLATDGCRLWSASGNWSCPARELRHASVCRGSAVRSISPWRCRRYCIPPMPRVWVRLVKRAFVVIQRGATRSGLFGRCVRAQTGLRSVCGFGYIGEEMPRETPNAPDFMEPRHAFETLRSSTRADFYRTRGLRGVRRTTGGNTGAE